MRTMIDSLYLYDPQFKCGADKFTSDESTSASAPITCLSDINDAMTQYCGVKQLIFDTHGAPGQIATSDGSNIEGIDFMFKAVPDAFFKREARVLFFGCNIGEGDKGDTFLDEIGKYLLRNKGGYVGATTVTNANFDFSKLGIPVCSEAFMMPLSFGRLKVRRYDAAGNVVGSKVVDRHGFNR
jgi:hypothetical protein